MRVSSCCSLRFGGQSYGRTISNFFLFDDPKYSVTCYVILVIAVYLIQTDQQRLYILREWLLHYPAARTKMSRNFIYRHLRITVNTLMLTRDTEHWFQASGWSCMFLFTGCFVRNYPESVLKLFLKLFHKKYTLYITRGLINVQCFIACTKK